MYYRGGVVTSLTFEENFMVLEGGVRVGREGVALKERRKKKTTNNHSGIQTEEYLTHGTTVKRPPSGVIARILIILRARFGGRQGSWGAHIHVTSKETLLKGEKGKTNM